jgi:hypothetical protein
MMRKTWNATLQKNQNCIAKKINGARNLQLWVEKKSIDEIATIRVTKQTIYSHFVKLIQTKAVAISEFYQQIKCRI